MMEGLIASVGLLFFAYFAYVDSSKVDKKDIEEMRRLIEAHDKMEAEIKKIREK